MLCTHIPKRRGRSAFTLVEAVIVVVIAGILLMIVVPNFFASSKRAVLARVRSDFRTLATAIESYEVDYDQPPIAPVNYARDTAPGVFRRVTNSIETFTPLTTPLAYVTTVSGFIDPFRVSTGEFHVSIDSKRPGFKSPGFLFINFTTGVNATNSKTWCAQPMTLDEFYPGFGNSIALTTAPVQFCFNGDTTRKYPATWVLIADGPSSGDDDSVASGNPVYPWEIWIGPGAGTRARERYTVTAGVCFYDPSNGTRSSRGHIWRFSSGGMDR